VVDPQVARSLKEANTSLLASLGSWGVVAMHWLPDTNGEPAVWLTTRTDAQRAALEAAPWLAGQVTMMLTRAQMPYETLRRIRVLVDSEEGHRLLLRDTE
jgi:hypothetical protein